MRAWQTWSCEPHTEHIISQGMLLWILITFSGRMSLCWLGTDLGNYSKVGQFLNEFLMSILYKAEDPGDQCLVFEGFYGATLSTYGAATA